MGILSRQYDANSIPVLAGAGAGVLFVLCIILIVIMQQRRKSNRNQATLEPGEDQMKKSTASLIENYGETG